MSNIVQRAITELMPRAASHVLHRNLKLDPFIAERAEGSYIYLKGGRQLFDASGGAAVTALGHSHPRIVKLIQEQVAQLTFCHSSVFTTEPIEDLATVLCKSANMERAIFLNGGTEAVETSLKLAYQYHVQKGQPQRDQFIARERSYHGNSIAALSLAHDPLRSDPFKRILGTNFHHISAGYTYRDQMVNEDEQAFVSRLVREFENKVLSIGADRVAAFYLETVMGTVTGCVAAPKGYLQAIKALCDKCGILLVLDEIMCGLGRTGYMHAWQYDGVQPDIQTLGKTLGSGYAAVSAVLINKNVADAFLQGSKTFPNGHTYQQQALGCRIASEILKVYEEDQLVERSRERGELLGKLLKEKLGDHPQVGDIRGRGLFWGIEFVLEKHTKEPFPKSINTSQLAWEACAAEDIMVFTTSIGGILLAPAYTITEEEVVLIADRVGKGVVSALQRASKALENEP